MATPGTAEARDLQEELARMVMGAGAELGFREWVEGVDGPMKLLYKLKAAGAASPGTFNEVMTNAKMDELFSTVNSSSAEVVAIEICRQVCQRVRRRLQKGLRRSRNPSRSSRSGSRSRSRSRGNNQKASKRNRSRSRGGKTNRGGNVGSSGNAAGAPAPAKMRQVAIRGEWAQFVDPSGAFLYKNVINGETQVDRPASFDNVKSASGATGLGGARTVTTIFVYGLPYAWTEEDVRQIFESFGTVSRVLIYRDKNTGGSLGSAVLDFTEARSALDAINMLNEKHVGGTKLLVELKDKEQFLRSQALPQ